MISTGKYKFTAARKRALRKARRRWTEMSPTARKKAMPGRRKGTFKRIPVGSYRLLDVGKPEGHYAMAQRTRYGWKPAKPSKRLLGAGWKKIKPGYYLRPKRRQ